MMLIGYRMLFGELCTMLNVHVDPDADYVEDDLAREKLVSSIMFAVRGVDLEVFVLSNDVYYLGLSLDTCQRLLPPIMTTRKMAEQIAAGSIRFQRELKKVGLFRYLDGKAKRFSDPVVIQCERVHQMVA